MFHDKYKFKIILILFFLTILAGFLRFYKLGEIPNSVNWDEAAMGYDAYSLVKTGRDQFGKTAPFYFRSLNDFKLPLYVYFSLPAVLIFGLSEFSIRVASAFIGTLSVVAMFFLCVQIYSDTKFKYKFASLAAFLIAISPWHIHFSRGAFETNIGTFLVILGILLFVKSVNGKIFTSILTGIVFGMMYFSYNSIKVASPVIFIMLSFIFKNAILKNKQKYFVSFIIFVLISGFVFLQSLSLENQIRFLSINDFRLEEIKNESIKNISFDQNNGSILGRIFHGYKVSILNYENVKKFFGNYIIHFHPDFFVKGHTANTPDYKMYHAPNFGIIYSFELIFIFLSFFLILKKIRQNKNSGANKTFVGVIFAMIIVAPLASATVWTPPSIIRAHMMILPLCILSAYFILKFSEFLKTKYESQKFFLSFFYFFLVLLYFSSFSKYIHLYFFHTNLENARIWLYEKKLAVKYTTENEKKYEKIIVSNNKTDWPYIFWLFYSKYPPAKYLSEGGTNSGDFRANEKFGKYEFIFFNQDTTTMNDKWLFILWPEDIKIRNISLLPNGKKVIETMNIVHEFRYPDGKLALVAAENKLIRRIVPVNFELK